MGCMMGLPMRPRLPLVLGLLALGLALAGCGAVESLKDAETATEAKAAEVHRGLDPAVTAGPPVPRATRNRARVLSAVSAASSPTSMASMLDRASCM